MLTRRRLRGRRFAVFIRTCEQSFRWIEALPVPNRAMDVVAVSKERTALRPASDGSTAWTWGWAESLIRGHLFAL